MTQELVLNKIKENKKEVTILFAGDSGDGIQLTGNQFSDTSAWYGNDVSTFANFPAEIRAPLGTLAGVSGFQIKLGSVEVFTPGDQVDVLVAMNAAALKTNVRELKKGGIIIANKSGFDKKNLKLAKYIDNANPLEDGSLSEYQVFDIDVTLLTRNALKDFELSQKEKDRSKNMFVLGFIYWMYNRDPQKTIDFLKKKFKKHPEQLNANIEALKVGYHFGDTSEAFTTRFEIKPAPLPRGSYRSITGNKALALGLIAASRRSGLSLFYGSYPITPASDILHELSRNKHFGVKTFQAEDEIAAICASIGASFGGALGVTASSGPGIALKAESIGLATILELPLVICNVQRGGPSTGLPTKTEQSDLFQALYGRNGEAPVPVLAAGSPADCFELAFEAVRIAVEYMTPVFLLSDGYIANGSEPWLFPKSADLKEIKAPFAVKKESNQEDSFLPYSRNEQLVRPWAIPGMEGMEHRIGGLEKEDQTGNVSYDPENHELMVSLREQKVENIADQIPLQKLESGEEKGELLILTWGSTYGAVKTAVAELQNENFKVSHAHVRYLHPLPKNLAELLTGFQKVLIPELNRGQFLQLIRSKFLVDAVGLNKVKGMPFTTAEIKSAVKKMAEQQ